VSDPATSCPRCKTPAVLGLASCPTCGATLDPPMAEPTVGPTVIRAELRTGPTQVAPERGSADTAQVGIRPGRRFGHYEVVRPLARGGMGVVFRAHDTKLDRPVALKVLIAGDLAGPEELARFRREALAAGRLRHPNIVPIHDVGVEEGWSYIAMELVEGSPLHLLLRERKVPIDEGVRIVLQITEGIVHAHKNGVIHRDLKPANVIVDEEGNARLTDFGLAKLEKGGDLTEKGTTLGTPNYMPPEQARGHVGEIDERSDVYALGAILYDVLTGRPPFVADTQMDILLKVIKEAPAPPRSINGRVPPELESICLRALEKEKEKRYQSARDFAQALEGFLDRDAALPEPQFRRVRRRRHSHRRLRQALAVGLSVLVIGGVLAYTLWPDETPVPTPVAGDPKEGARWRLAKYEPFTETWPAKWTLIGVWSISDRELVSDREGSITLQEELDGCVAIELEFVADRQGPATLQIRREGLSDWIELRPGRDPALVHVSDGKAGAPVLVACEPSRPHTLRVEWTPLELRAWWDAGIQPALRAARPRGATLAGRAQVASTSGRARFRQVRVHAESEYYAASGFRAAERLEAEGKSAEALAAYEGALTAHPRGSLADEARQAVERLKPLVERPNPPK